MNRHYDREKYLALVDKARSYMPELVLTTDIIVGFPGETAEDFAETLSLVERVRYDAMFTFIFSPREGTPAAAMPDPVPSEEKQRWFDTLVETANRISGEKHAGIHRPEAPRPRGRRDGPGEYNLSARTNGGRWYTCPATLARRPFHRGRDNGLEHLGAVRRPGGMIPGKEAAAWRKRPRCAGSMRR